MCSISSKKRVKCSNSSCHFVYQFQDIIHPLINDKGYVVFKCPNCGNLTKTKVNNIDIYDLHPNFVRAYELDEYTGDIIEMDSIDDDFKSEDKISVENRIWDTKSIEFYKRCQTVIDQNSSKISKELKDIENAYLASIFVARDIERLLFKINIEGQDCLLIKRINSERDFTTDNLVFVGTNELKIKSLANGVYDRDYCYNILDNALRRWNVLSNQIVFVSPFIGFDYKTDKYDGQIIKYWRWLDEIIDIGKTIFVTRKKTINRLKEALRNKERTYDVLKEWDALSDLLKVADRYDGRKQDANKSRVQTYSDSKFHAKFYAGIIDEDVEVLMGSYNIHQGKSLENITFHRYPRKEFQKRFLDPFKIKITDFIQKEDYFQSALIEINNDDVNTTLLNHSKYKELIYPYL